MKGTSKILIKEIAFKILLLMDKTLIVSFKGPYAKANAMITLFDDLKDIKEDIIQDEIKRLYRNKLFRIEYYKGDKKYLLTSKGKKYLKKYTMEGLTIKDKRHHGKWTIVFFDIPENIKKDRNAFRSRLKILGFYELQRSVFICPYICEKEIDFLIDYYDIRKYTRLAIVEKIDNELHLKKIFNLI
ncbi:MAG: CRISPR-associated endonuclease Cas2 [Elusimicrobiales bacterium]|nr:CRISPR-associated endonuclease Cas2 [Elusimicrobiales bacterium]